MSLPSLRALPIAAALALTACPRGPSPGQAEQLSSFDYAWTRVRDTYPDPDFHGLDWSAIGDELRPRAAAARDAAELRPVLEDLFSRLGDSHFGVIPGGLAPPAPRGADGADADEVHIGGRGEVGLDLRLIDGALIVCRVNPGGAAERAGVRTGWRLTRIQHTDVAVLLDALGPEGAARSGRGVALARMSGPPGAALHLELTDGQGQLQSADLVRQETQAPWVTLGSLPPMPVHFESEVLPGGVGVIRFDLFMEPVPQRFTPAMGALLAAGVTGMVLDMRGNPGGVAPMAMGLAGHFFSERGLSLGTLRFRDATLKLVINPRAERFDGPLAVLVDHLSASSSEILAAGLQKLGRARVFGEQSAGMALPSTWEELPNGDLIQFVTADFTDPTGARVEGAGVIPDVNVPWTTEALLAGQDPALEAALAWLRSAPATP